MCNCCVCVCVYAICYMYGKRIPMVMSTILSSHDVGCTEENLVITYLSPVLSEVQCLYSILSLQDSSMARDITTIFIGELNLHNPNKMEVMNKGRKDVELMETVICM